MHDVVDVRNIKATACQVSADHDVGRAIGKAVESILALLLLKSSMEGTQREASLAQEVSHTFHTLTVVQEHHRALLTPFQQQLSEGFELVVLWTFNGINMYAR